MLHPQAQDFLDELAAYDVSLPWECDSADEARLVQQRFWAPPREVIDVGAVLTRTIPGPGGEIPIRVYHPEGGRPPFPALIWMHGGCWMLGSLDGADDTCRALCAYSGVAIVSVDYRLAPEHRFPAGLEDVKTTAEWIAAHGEEIGVDPGRLAIGGDSAGGNLAAVVAQELRGRLDRELLFQVLVYPMTGTPWDGRPSQAEFATGYYLTLEAIKWFADFYVRSPADYGDRRLAPILATELAGLPPALVITAGYDTLRDEGEDYARLMSAAGVEVDLHRYDDQLHSFFGVPGRFDAATVARREVAATVRARLVGSAE